MKYNTHLLILIPLLLATPAIAHCQPNQSGNQYYQVINDEKKITIPIEGMSCMACVARVKKTLSAIDGVKEVDVSLQHKNATVKYDPKKVTPEQLKKAINKTSYKAGNPQELQE